MTDKKKRYPQILGKRSAEIYSDLLDQEVIVQVASGHRFKGTLIGVDQYELILRQESGLELILAKGNVIYVHSAGKYAPTGTEGVHRGDE